MCIRDRLSTERSQIFLPSATDKRLEKAMSKRTSDQTNPKIESGFVFPKIRNEMRSKTEVKVRSKAPVAQEPTANIKVANSTDCIGVN